MDVILIGAKNPETARMINAVKRFTPNFNVIGFLDNDSKKHGKEFIGYPVIGGFEKLYELIQKKVYFVNLITGNIVARYETSHEIAKAGGSFVNFIHPSVNLEMVTLGLGNYIQENVVVQADVKIGHNSSIHIGSLIGHETEIGNSTFIAHGCNISGCVTIEDGVTMGTGVSVIPRVRIGKGSIIGAGTVIINDIPPCSVAVGNPGKVIKSVEYKWESGDIFI